MAKGLQKRFIDEAKGDFKVAWKLQKAAQAAGHNAAEHHHAEPHHVEHHAKEHRPVKHRRAPRETVIPTPDGSEVTSGRAGGLRAFIQAHTVIKYDEEQTAWIWRGFVDAMREDLSGQPDLSTFAPAGHGEVNAVVWRHGAQERELGREMWRLFGKALLFFKVTPDEMAKAYEYGVRGVMPMLPQAAPQAGPRAPLPSNVPAQTGAWSSPLSGPSAVTSAFDAKDAIRGNEYHRGVDLRAADGTPVVAPFRMMVRKVFEETEGGNVVKATIVRPDGVFPDIDYNSQDDTGFILTFAHLQRVLVPENTVLEQGQQFAESGHSGTAQNGPHLHFAVEYVIDRTFPFSDMRIFVNPEALIPRAVIEGASSPRPVQANTAATALIMPRTDDAAKALGLGKDTQIGQVIFNGDGTLVVNGTAVPLNLKPVLHLSSIGAGGDLAFPAQLLPPQVKSVASDLVDMGRRVVSGVGDLAGHAFEVLTSKDGIVGLSNVMSAATQGLAAALGIAGPAASLVGPALSAIPYAGPFLTAAAEIGGPIASIAAPIVGALGGMANVGGKVLGSSTEASSAELANQLGLNLSANRQA